MKMKIHTLKTPWLIAAMMVAVAIGETIAWQISRVYDVRFWSVGAAAVCVGLVAFAVSVLYDGHE